MTRPMKSNPPNKVRFAVTLAILVLVGCSTARQSSSVTLTSRITPIDHWNRVIGWSPEADPEVRDLLKARYDAALSAYKTESSFRDAGRTTTEMILRLADIVLVAKIDLAETPQEVIQALEMHLNSMKELELQARQRLSSSTLAPSNEQNLTLFWRLSAELDLRRTQRYFQLPRAK